jgi:hypothetical protein
VEQGPLFTRAWLCKNAEPVARSEMLRPGFEGIAAATAPAFSTSVYSALHRFRKPSQPTFAEPLLLMRLRALGRSARRSQEASNPTDTLINPAGGEIRRTSWQGTTIRSPACTSFGRHGKAATESNCAVSICGEVAASERWYRAPHALAS